MFSSSDSTVFPCILILFFNIFFSFLFSLLVHFYLFIYFSGVSFKFCFPPPGRKSGIKLKLQALQFPSSDDSKALNIIHGLLKGFNLRNPSKSKLVTPLSVSASK